MPLATNITFSYYNHMVKRPKGGKWLPAVLDRIHKLAQEKKILFTHKAALEVGSIGLGLDFDDVCDVLSSLEKDDFQERLISHTTQEWLYVFKPEVGGTVLYVKLLLRNDCVVISFHEDEDEI